MNCRHNCVKKPTVCQKYSHSRSENPRSLKQNSEYNQNQMCSTSTQAIACIIDRARILGRMVLLNKNAIEGKHKFPNSYTFNRGLHKVKSIAGKHWYILHVTPKYKEIFCLLPLRFPGKTK